MTRINLVSPDHLTNKHLMAEYRELPRVFPLAHSYCVKNIRSKEFPQFSSFTLNQGHVKFFYDKLKWLDIRYVIIFYKLKFRGYALNYTQYGSIRNSMWKIQKDIKDMGFRLNDNWRPSPEEIYLSMARLCKRSKIESVLNELNEDN